jgi:hypothetical protein
MYSLFHLDSSASNLNIILYQKKSAIKAKKLWSWSRRTVDDRSPSAKSTILSQEHQTN